VNTPATNVSGTVKLPDLSTMTAVEQRAKDMLANNTVPGDALKLASFRIPEAAIHDFSYHVFLRNPNNFTVNAGNSDLEAFLQEAYDYISKVVEAWCIRHIDVGAYAYIGLSPHFGVFKSTIYKLFLAYAAESLYELYLRLQPGFPGSSGSTRDDVLGAFAHWLRTLVVNATFNPGSIDSSFDNPSLWVDSPSQIKQVFSSLYPGVSLGVVGLGQPGYSFVPFSTGSINFGLRLVYRQEWRPLGTQPGEIVRTIPLGPKQTERVSTKVVFSKRESRSTDTLVSQETSTEASEVTKESSDVVEEASSSLKWHVDAEASASAGFVSAKLSAGVAGETANSSKDSKSRLNETMQKTASRMRRDVKVVVSTEQTLTDETTRTSEIANPNDEIAITYVYSKLQRQYEICTTLAEVNSVVFVPERVPDWNEIDDEWIARHDWILGKALLDGSFASDLAEIAREPDEVPDADSGDIITSIAAKTPAAIDGYRDFKGGGDLPDFFSAVQAGYERNIERKRGIQRNKLKRDRRRLRLIRHIQQNILHYMRAIWSAEDADQRLRRYDRIMVPTRWTFVPAGPSLPAQVEVNGEFVPDTSPDSLKPLSEVINPAGPVGYAGNYAVFYLRGDPTLATLNQALARLRIHYVRFVVDVGGAAAAGVYVRQAVALEPLYADMTYQATYASPGWQVTLANGNPVATDVSEGDTLIQFDGIVVRLDVTPPAGSALTVRVLATGELEDPEMRLLRLQYPLPKPADEPAFFSDSLLWDMASFVPAVMVALAPPWTSGWTSLSPTAQAVVKTYYHLYLQLKEHTRRFLLETNNLVLDLDVGKTPALEEFKRLHRVVDVMKVLEETIRAAYENSRIEARLSSGDFDDPDIDKVVLKAT
jgi:hypothetical protein